MPPQLLLFWNSDRRKCTLRFEDAIEYHSFSTTDDAMRFASSLVRQETKITVYNFFGNELLKSTVFPLA